MNQPSSRKLGTNAWFHHFSTVHNHLLQMHLRIPTTLLTLIQISHTSRVEVEQTKKSVIKIRMIQRRVRLEIRNSRQHPQ
jgi:hypothetical protein